MNGEFGKFLKNRRRMLGKTLRQWCSENGFEPGNMSKIERGILPPPHSKEKLSKYAKALEISEGSDEWLDFFDLAAVERGRLPESLTDDKIAGKLPLFFRTLRNKRIDEDKLDELIELIKKA